MNFQSILGCIRLQDATLEGRVRLPILRRMLPGQVGLWGYLRDAGENLRNDLVWCEQGGVDLDKLGMGVCRIACGWKFDGGKVCRQTASERPHWM